jgi:hypothetical protein
MKRYHAVARLGHKEVDGMHASTTTTRRIQVTDADMETLRELIREGRRAARRDRGHLAALDAELDRADVNSNDPTCVRHRDKPGKWAERRDDAEP